jgi:hypothetical protein
MLAVAAALGAGLGAALITLAGVILSVVAIVGPAEIGLQNTRFFYLLFYTLGAAAGVAFALFLGAFSSVIIATAVLPRVMGWLGALVALVLLAAGGGVASTRDVFFVLGFIGFAGAAIWIIVISVLMYRAGGSRAAEPVSAA